MSPTNTNIRIILLVSYLVFMSSSCSDSDEKSFGPNFRNSYIYWNRSQDRVELFAKGNRGFGEMIVYEVPQTWYFHRGTWEKISTKETIPRDDYECVYSEDVYTLYCIPLNIMRGEKVIKYPMEWSEPSADDLDLWCREGDSWRRLKTQGLVIRNPFLSEQRLVYSPMMQRLEWLIFDEGAIWYLSDNTWLADKEPSLPTIFPTSNVLMDEENQRCLVCGHPFSSSRGIEWGEHYLYEMGDDYWRVSCDLKKQAAYIEDWSLLIKDQGRNNILLIAGTGNEEYLIAEVMGDGLTIKKSVGIPNNAFLCSIVYDCDVGRFIVLGSIQVEVNSIWRAPMRDIMWSITYSENDKAYKWEQIDWTVASSR